MIYINQIPMKRIVIILCYLVTFTNSTIAQDWYKLPSNNTTTRWNSFENPEAIKGAGGQENKGAKGHAFDQVGAGKTITLLNVKGAGIINRIWLTISDRSPIMLRSLRIDMYWDGTDKPAVSAPLGDFFGVGLGQCVPFENELFSDPEGRSFNCYIPMPFKKGARITVTNESDKDLRSLFYDVNLIQPSQSNDDILYFHAYWNRQLKTVLTKDYEIVPRIEGMGRFLGVNMGVQTNPIYEDTWWGEGEVKIYLDGDTDYPTLIGTGTEDYIGTGWGQGTYAHRFQGSLIADSKKGSFAFYRYHIPDPVYFYQDIKVTIQQIGGCPKEKVMELIANGAPLIPISIDSGKHGLLKLLDQSDSPNLNDPNLLDGWTNFFRQDDVSSVAYFYLDKPSNNLPALASPEFRTRGLVLK